ncbi:MAG: DUF5067 domain-containing protein [Clostridia bacterium]|nr:DUF5067 domain-containing protein [Clostridia bacterium]
MRKFLILLLSMTMLVCVTACQKNQSDTTVSGGSAQNGTAKEILDTKDGTIKCVGIEKANSKLCDEKNAYVVKFEFTNKKQDAQECQDQFAITCFQNNVEADELPSYNTNGGEQYKLLHNYFKELLKDGTITIGKGYIFEDSSPVTVIMRTNGGENEDSATVTLSLEDIPVIEEITAEKVTQDLQGSWSLGETTITFSGNNVSFDDKLNGTYTVNTETANVEAELIATDGKVTVKMPYEYEDGKLKVFNNSGEALKRKIEV